MSVGGPFDSPRANPAATENAAAEISAPIIVWRWRMLEAKQAHVERLRDIEYVVARHAHTAQKALLALFRSEPEPLPGRPCRQFRRNRVLIQRWVNGHVLAVHVWSHDLQPNPLRNSLPDRFRFGEHVVHRRPRGKPAASLQLSFQLAAAPTGVAAAEAQWHIPLAHDQIERVAVCRNE